MTTVKHQFAGRVAVAPIPHVVSFCTCGYGFYGNGASAADTALQVHIDRIAAKRQRFGELWAQIKAANEGGDQPGAFSLIGTAVGALIGEELNN